MYRPIQQGVTVRCLILSEPHNDDFSHITTQADVAIHDGNMPIIGGLQNYSRVLGQLRTLNTELKLVITKRHDLPTDVKWGTLDNFPKAEDGNYAQPSEARRLFDAAREENGIHLLDQGLHAFTLSNGRSFKVWITPKLEGFYYPGTRAEDYESIDKSARTRPESGDTAMIHLPRPWALPDEPTRPNSTANFLNQGHYQPLNTSTPTSSIGYFLNQIHPGAPVVSGRPNSTADFVNQGHHGERCGCATPFCHHETLDSHGSGPMDWSRSDQLEAGGASLRRPARDTGVIHALSDGKILLIETANTVRPLINEFPLLFEWERKLKEARARGR